MTEYINQILAHTDLFVSGVVGLCVVGGILIEYSPIPLNPVRKGFTIKTLNCIRFCLQIKKDKRRRNFKGLYIRRF